MPEPELRAQPFHLQGVHFGVPTGSTVPADKFRALTGPFALTPPQAGYIFSRAEVVTTNGEEYARLRAYPRDTTEALNHGTLDPPDVTMIATGDVANPTEPNVRSIVVGWKPDNPFLGDSHNYYWDLDVIVIWKPSQQHLGDLAANYRTALATYTAAKERAFKESMYKARAPS